jgi:hypothetical protein
VRFMGRALFAIASLFLPVALAQTDVTPQTGYVSSGRYVNAFFGFMLPFPEDAELHDFVLSSDPDFVFGLQAQRKSLTALTVRATKVTGDPTQEARKSAAGPDGKRTKQIQIGGREFWESEAQERIPAGKMRTLTYATATNGYTLQFLLVSFDAKLTQQLQRGIESISFFDPSQAKSIAGPDARAFEIKPEPVTTAPMPPLTIGQLKLGTVSGNVFTNEQLGFSFRFPAGWVIADKATQEKVTETGHQAAWGNDPAAAREHELLQQCSRNLLWVTKYPEGTHTDDVNPLIAIVALDPACVPGASLPKSTEDVDAIRGLAGQFSQYLSSTPFMGKGRNSVSAFTLENRIMLDLSSAFSVDVPNEMRTLNVFTSMIFTKEKGYWVMWFFMDGRQSGLDKLRKDVSITFTPAVPNPEASPR